MSESLNIQLAKLLGWTVKLGGDPELPNMFCLFNRNGGLEYHSTDADSAWDGIPDFEHSLDAVTAVLPEDMTFALQALLPEGFICYLYPLYPDGRGATRQEAAARALLAYLEWKEEQKQDRNPIEHGEG